MDHAKGQTELLTYAGTRQPAFWAGLAAPAQGMTASDNLFNGRAGYREHSQHHGRYAAVYLVDLNIGHYLQWPVILDEALRLIAFNTSALFCVRFTQSPFLSVFAFAGYLERRRDFSFDIIDQDSESGDYTFILSCHRQGEPMTLDSFDFGMISNGANIPALETFIRSVSAITGIAAVDWSIPLCGPTSLSEQLDLSFLGAERGRVRFVAEPDAFQQAGWITKKKNLIVAGSTAENILIAHDRFVLPPDFLERMSDFGGDFSLIVPRQIDENDERVGDWVSIESHWNWAPQRLLSYDDYDENIYVNGGIIIAKRAVLADQGWSNFLFWDQAEDVELSRRLCAHGVTPRMAPDVVVRTRQTRSNYGYNFCRVTRAGDWSKQPLASLGVHMDLQGTTSHATFSQGLTLWEWDWSFTSDGLLLASDSGEISFRYDYTESASLMLEVVSGSDAKLTEMRLNGQRLSLVWETMPDGTHRCEIPLKVPALIVPQLILWIKASPGFCVKALTLAEAAPAFSFPVAIDGPATRIFGLLGKGWSNCETRRVWSDGPHAALRLPIAPGDRGKPHRLALDLAGYGRDEQKRQAMSLAIDGKKVATADVRIGRRHTRHIFTIGEEFTDVERLNMELSVADPVSPFELRRTGDSRKLGISLARIDWKVMRPAFWRLWSFT